MTWATSKALLAILPSVGPLTVAATTLVRLGVAPSAGLEAVDWWPPGMGSHKTLLRIVTLPPLQKNFVNIFSYLPGDLALKKGGDFGEFLWPPFPGRQSAKNLRKIRGNFGGKFGRKFRMKILKIRELSLCNFSELIVRSRSQQLDIVEPKFDPMGERQGIPQKGVRGVEARETAARNMCVTSPPLNCETNTSFLRRSSGPLPILADFSQF